MREIQPNIRLYQYLVLVPGTWYFHVPVLLVQYLQVLINY